ncbi:MAG: hypothetical protein AAF585_19220, partial [Verrucomicrobiota bacterium]
MAVLKKLIQSSLVLLLIGVSAWLFVEMRSNPEFSSAKAERASNWFQYYFDGGRYPLPSHFDRETSQTIDLGLI